MKQVTINLYNFNELSKAAQTVARQECQYDIESILEHHIVEITASYKAFCSEVGKGNFDLNKHDYPLTGVYYDHDFIELLESDSESYSVDAAKLLLKLKRAEKRNVESVEYLTDFFEANEVYFLESGKVYQA